ncbi:hypothetical protein [Coleofasciculus chthonoplastes]|nr:hypothetical protein [Coleofasciculus chthonoplastes]
MADGDTERARKSDRAVRSERFSASTVRSERFSASTHPSWAFLIG